MGDGLPRAYLRLDPNIDQHPDPLGMVLLLCAAARQPDRGRFRDVATLQRAVGRTRVRAMIARHDIEELSGGGWYVVGWDEWQEGDFTVAERMRRMRTRRRGGRIATVTPVTVDASPARNVVTTVASSTDSSVSIPNGVGVGVEIPLPPAKLGKRQNGSNPRALGTNPRAQATNPRSVHEAEKSGPTHLAEVMRQIAAKVAES